MPKKSKEPEIVFGALILSHGRADSVATVDSLRKFGYTGPIKFLVDDEDETVDVYREKFGEENVILFSKAEAAKIVDVMDNQGHYRGVVYARNASFGVAEALGWTHFIMLDDDYIDWRWCFGPDRKYAHPTIVSLDRIFASLVSFLDSTPTLTIAMAQAGDLIGGQQSGNLEVISLGRKGVRKAMNTFVCRVDRPFRFSGRINEDVNAYLFLGATGKLFFTTNLARVTQTQTQTNKGGLTELYRDSGTYVKTFFSVMGAPSCVKISPLISKFPRWHHRVNWKNAVPKILREEHRKTA